MTAAPNDSVVMGAAMALHHIRGQDHALRLLHNALDRERLAHAYLFAGPPGTGKHTTALQVAKALACETAAPDACDACVACHKIETGNHPDVLDIQPEGASIRIEHIRTIQHRLSYKPYESRRITVILDRCEALTPPATNALLKVLEEPPTHALMLLLTTHKAVLPLTITSRCQVVPFRALGIDHIRAILTHEGIEADAATLATMASQGGLGRPDDIVDVLTTRNHALTLLTEIAQANAASVFMQARKLAGKREQCETLLSGLALLYRDLVMLRVAPSRPLFNDDLRADLTPLARRYAVDALLEASAHIEKMRRYLSMNLNPQLVFEQLVIHLQQLAVP